MSSQESSSRQAFKKDKTTQFLLVFLVLFGSRIGGSDVCALTLGLQGWAVIPACGEGHSAPKSLLGKSLGFPSRVSRSIPLGTASSVLCSF